MPGSLISIHHQFSAVSNFGPFHCQFYSNKSTCWRCQRQMEERSGGGNKNYYGLLGDSIDSTSKQIKETYRQKKYHRDIAGQEGHERTLLLNQAYKLLMTEGLSRKYDASIGRNHKWLGKDAVSSLGYSSWKGPLRPRLYSSMRMPAAENVQCANNTFAMDESLGCARVKVQFGNDDGEIEIAVDSCPVNCIHWVDAEGLRVLEHLIRPQPKAGHGILGQGWERPANIFAAAKAFTEQLKRQAENSSRMWRVSP